MKITLAEREHLDGIRAISNEAIRTTAANFNSEPESLETWTEEWEQTRHRYPWLVAVTDDGRVAGFAKASAYKGRCAYHWTPEVTVYIDSGHHRKGIGRALYRTLLKVLRLQGYHTCVGAITIPNDASEGLHAALGFERIGVLHQAGWKFETWHDVAYWQCHLQDEEWKPGSIRDVGDVWNAALPEY